MRVQFTKTTRFESEGRHQGPLYEAGSVHDLRQDLAEKWIRRAVAVPAPAETPAPVAEAAPVPPGADPAPATPDPAAGATDGPVPSEETG